MKNAKFTNSAHTVFSVEVEETIVNLDSEGRPTGETSTRVIVQSGAVSEDNPLYLKMVSDEIAIAEYVSPPQPFKVLSRPAFMFMAKKLGMTKQSMLDLVATNMSGDQRDIAEAVIEDHNEFHRTNELLNSLVDLAPGLDSEAVDVAWRQAEKIKW